MTATLDGVFVLVAIDLPARPGVGNYFFIVNADAEF
jgi:hypothetical protein